MSLVKKLFLILFLILFLFLTVFAVVEQQLLQRVVYPEFAELERREAVKDIHRVVEAVNREAFHLDNLCAEWASWDDSHLFVLDGNQRFQQSHLGDNAFVQSRLNLIHFLQLQE